MKRSFSASLIAITIPAVVLFAGSGALAQTPDANTWQEKGEIAQAPPTSEPTAAPTPPPPETAPPVSEPPQGTPTPQGTLTPQGVSNITQQVLPPAPPARRIVSSQPVILPVSPQTEEVPQSAEQAQQPMQQVPPVAPPVTATLPASQKPPVKKPPTTPPVTTPVTTPPITGEQGSSKLATKKEPAVSRPAMKEPHVMEGGIKSDLPPGWDEVIPLPPGGIRIEDLPQPTPPAQGEGK